VAEAMIDGLVSIITPAYQAARFIGETIASVRAQTYGNWELIIVDDQSSDDTCDVVERVATVDSRVKLSRHAANRGPVEARDTALTLSTGQYVAFLDGDDLWMPQKLERQLSYMRSRNAAISYTRFRRMTEDGSHVGRLIPIPKTLSYGQLLRNTAMATSTVVIDRAICGPFRMPMTACDDYALWLEIVRRGYKSYGLDEDLMRYRVVSSSFSRNKRKYALKVWRTYRDIGLSLPHAAWCFANYAGHAWLKYRRF
jgi:teichuronic acid biosynthesis glycosyltransferase TuaG